MSLGIYISVPFCRSKCSYCNFASGVSAATQMERYVERVCADISSCREIAAECGAGVPGAVDSIYVSRGSPSLLLADQLTRFFARLAGTFPISPEAEITVECAPAILCQPWLEALGSCRVNRV